MLCSRVEMSSAVLWSKVVVGSVSLLVVSDADSVVWSGVTIGVEGSGVTAEDVDSSIPGVDTSMVVVFSAADVMHT